MLALQRRFLTRDRGQWRTWSTLAEKHAPDAMELAEQLARISEPMALRIVRDDREQKALKHWTADKGWH